MITIQAACHVVSIKRYCVKAIHEVSFAFLLLLTRPDEVLRQLCHPCFTDEESELETDPLRLGVNIVT
jgi:hypothetical protein